MNKEKIWIWLAWHLPKDLVYWATIRLMSRATMGDMYRDIQVPMMTIVQALSSWTHE
jgi:hypothetical protein